MSTHDGVSSMAELVVPRGIKARCAEPRVTGDVPALAAEAEAIALPIALQLVLALVRARRP